MEFKFDDGGRSEAGYKGTADDCVVRAIAIATEKPYQEVYDAINMLAQRERITLRKKKKSSARTGIFKRTYHDYLKSIGWEWYPTMLIGSGCKIHLRDGELPMGRLIVRISKHLTAVIDGVIHDTHDQQRSLFFIENGIKRVTGRCVYGYFTRGTK